MNNLAAFRKKLEEGQLCVGIGIFLSDPAVSELIGEAGYDFTFFDMEHGPHTLESATNHLHALRGSDTAALIRVPAPDPVLMKPILDLYPAGIIIPQVRSAKEARTAVRGALYPPRGERGFGPMRGIRYGAVDGSDYLDSHDQFIVVQIEHIDAVAELDEILAIDGLDAALIGPNDLSGSMNRLGQTGDPELNEIIDDVARRIKAAGKYLGTATGGSEENVRRWVGRGIDFIATEDDFVNLYSSSLDLLNNVRRFATQ